MADATLVLHQLRYDLLSTLRNPAARFFAIALPVIFFVLLASIFGNHTRFVDRHAIKNSTYYVPGISTLGIVATSFVNMVITITDQRESGALKRRRSTPVPAWVLIAGRALAAVLLSYVVVVVLVVIGRLGYGVRLPGSTIPAYALAVAVGAICFCGLSYALTSFIRTAESAQPILQAIVLPLYFISGVFIPSAQLSGTLKDIASVFPVSHLNNALFEAFNPATKGAGIAGHDLLILAIWTVGGLVVGLRRFSWSPRAT
ncbi:MAG TPA: ABC transporter permease [Solirubrobacteraceae bacterium]|nr:ABC transporter permease [Solirubrobacteraceae bacterium]